MGSTLSLRLFEMHPEHITFEINHGGPKGLLLSASPALAGTDAAGANPGLMLAERAIHTCGGNLTTEITEDGRAVVRIVLPRNATTGALRREGVR
jgi:hypothetical protein